ncbi:hypothetical protein [Amycolatopsis sp. MtRt-6]|uniref:hypothetical protein n=1 Tax=Amycolatopsis sp. MtRt-6 TaxID=2792782 RepID=UPI001A8E7789|nr:hypothetical protein [Amycolatopsis sp. MtRt-6]
MPALSAHACWREDAILAAVNHVYAEYLFGHRRIDLLTPQLDQADDRERTERRERRARLEKRAADFARKQSNILSQAEDADPTDPFTQGLKDRYNAIGAERQLLLDQIAQLDQDDQESPATATREDLDVLDLLPHLAVNLHRAPAELQVRLYELTKLRVNIDHETDHAMIDITLPGDRIEEVATAAADAEVVRMAKPQVDAGVIAAGAPGAIHAATSRGQRCRELQICGSVEVERRRRGGSS